MFLNIFIVTLFSQRKHIFHPQIQNVLDAKENNWSGINVQALVYSLNSTSP